MNLIKQITILLLLTFIQMEVQAKRNSKTAFQTHFHTIDIYIDLDANKTSFNYGYNRNWDMDKDADNLLKELQSNNSWKLRITISSKAYNENQEINSELISRSMKRVIPLLKSDSIAVLEIQLKECAGIYSKLIMDELNMEIYENILELSFHIQIHSDVHFTSFSAFPNLYGLYIYLNDRTNKEEVINLNSSYLKELQSLEKVTIYATKHPISTLENKEETILQNTSVRFQNESKIEVKNKSIKDLRIISKEIDSGFLKLINDFEHIKRLEIETNKIPNLSMINVDEVFFLYTHSIHPGYDLEEAFNSFPSRIIKLNLWSFNSFDIPKSISRFNQIQTLQICNPFVYENLKEIKELTTIRNIRLYQRTEFLGQNRFYFNNEYIQRVTQYYDSIEIGRDSFVYVLNKKSHKSLKQLGKAIATLKPDTVELPIEYLLGFRYRDIAKIEKHCVLKIINESLIDKTTNIIIWDWYQKEFRVKSKTSKYLRFLLF